MHLISTRRGAAALITLTILLGSTAACSDAGKALEKSDRTGDGVVQVPGDSVDGAGNGIRNQVDAQNQANKAAMDDGLDVTNIFGENTTPLEVACKISENSETTIETIQNYLKQQDTSNGTPSDQVENIDQQYQKLELTKFAVKLANTMYCSKPSE